MHGRSEIEGSLEAESKRDERDNGEERTLPVCERVLEMESLGRERTKNGTSEGTYMHRLTKTHGIQNSNTLGLARKTGRDANYGISEE